MYGFNLVAIYESQTNAERVYNRLLTEGFRAGDVQLTRAPATQTAGAGTAASESQPGFFDWLFGTDAPATERDDYDAHFAAGRTAVSLRIADERLRQRAIEIMDEGNPVDIENKADTAQATGRGRENEQVIPVVNEELDVGKRTTERRYRVKTYVIDKPIEQQVTLRDEHVEIERRPATGAAAGRMPQQREMEVIERHEEPVVGKRSRTAEEVVVRKEVTERPETVRGTVRETKVDVDKEPAIQTERRR